MNATDDAGDRDRASEPLFVSSIRKDEPIVTRIELRSYYRWSLFMFPPVVLFLTNLLKCTTMEIMYVGKTHLVSQTI